MVKRLPRHDVWLSLSGEVRGFIRRVKTKPLICLGLSEGWGKTCLPWLNGLITSVHMCVYRVRDVSGGCFLVRISFGERFQTCGAAWVRLAGRLFPSDLINTYFTPFTHKKHTVITVLMCSHWGKGQTLYPHFKNVLPGCDYVQRCIAILQLIVAHYDDV